MEVSWSFEIKNSNCLNTKLGEYKQSLKKFRLLLIDLGRCRRTREGEGEGVGGLVKVGI